MFSATLPGGHSVRVDLTLANDGREFAERSVVDAQLDCSKYGLFEFFELDGSIRIGSHAVQVPPDGRFSYEYRYHGRLRMSITGHFEKRGRVAAGSVVISEDRPCPRVAFRFRARLVGRPNAPVPGRWAGCDRVVTNAKDFPASTALGQFGTITEGFYGIYDNGAGCTAARQFTRRWNASTRCRQLHEWASCSVKGANCTRIRGGDASSLSGARCTPIGRRSGAVELLRFEPCRPPTTVTRSADVWAINVGCDAATSYPVDSLLSDPSGNGPCGSDMTTGARQCTSVAGYTCRANVTLPGPRFVLTALCTQDADRFRAIRIELRY